MAFRRIYVFCASDWLPCKRGRELPRSLADLSEIRWTGWYDLCALNLYQKNL